MKFDEAGIDTHNGTHSGEHKAEHTTVKVVLAGNPNVGKSLFFNYLSGTYVDVSNFPGTTVSITKATYKNYTIYDTPGIYGVSSFNDEEKVARDIILEADIIINVVNSLYIERDLFLTQQLIDMGKKVVVFLNFYDEVKKRKIEIDRKKLSRLLGVEVFKSSAATGKGFDDLDEAIERARSGNPVPEIAERISGLAEKIDSIPHALMITEGDPYIADAWGEIAGTADNKEFVYLSRRKYVNEICSEVEFENTKKGRIFNSIGRIAINPVTGIPFLIVILAILYYLIGDVVSQKVVGFTEKEIGQRYFEYYLKDYVANFTPVTVTVRNETPLLKQISEKTYVFSPNINADARTRTEFESLAKQQNSKVKFFFPSPVVRLFFGEFGVISMTITYLIFLLLPLVVAFYFTMAFLEDCGYLPRLATMMDRSLTRIGLNGKAIIPILLGFGCVTMATITTRILGTNRERTIATAILQFVIPCSAQLAVITVLMSRAGSIPLLIYVSVIFTVLIVLSTILNKIIPGTSSPLLLDLPMMRFPKIGNLLQKTYYRSLGFMKEAAVWFFVGALFVGVLDITNLLYHFQNLLAPVTVHWLKLPKEAATAFVMGLVRRDFGTAGLFNLGLTPMQITVAIITITLFVPCIASVMVMLKERGFKEGLIIWVGTWIGAFAIGGIVAQIIIK